MNFEDVVIECSKNKEFVKEFDRLTGHHLSNIENRSQIDRMINEATGRDEKAIAAFVEFVNWTIWQPLNTV